MLSDSTANFIVVSRAVALFPAMAAAVSHDVQKQKLPRQFEDVVITFSHHASPFRFHVAAYHKRFYHIEETDFHCNCGLRRAQLSTSFHLPRCAATLDIIVVQGAHTAARTSR